MNRRRFIHLSALTTAAASTRPAMAGPGKSTDAPLLHLDAFQSPLVIESIELLRHGREYLVRIRSRDGAESVTVPNSARMKLAAPVFLQRVAPFFIGKDARDIEALLDGVYRHASNYKLQGLLFWVSVAAVEMAILDLLGTIAGKPIGELFGGIRRKRVAVYRASGNRGNTPDEEITHLRRLVAESGARALKFRLGGRMSNNADSLPGRTEALIPLVRETFGPEMTLYADSNSSYDAREAIRIGRLMEEHDYAFFEEPCPFDDWWSTHEVTKALDIPVAGGEQEFSLRRFRWVIENRIVDIVQPDLHYFGGFIRCARVARMANARGMSCTVHMSGAGLGILHVLHFTSFVANPGAHQEFKGEPKIPLEVRGGDLKCRNGMMSVPTGPGFGVTIDPDFVAKAAPVR
jgi:L-alanine-DL-glutamate epimerase-like enolase superfamily enzyme